MTHEMQTVAAIDRIYARSLRGIPEAKRQYEVTLREDRGWLYNEKHDWHEYIEIVDAKNQQEAYEKALELAEINSQRFDTVVYKKDIKLIR